MSTLTALGLPDLEFKICTCGRYIHKVLLENGSPYKYGFPAYTKELLANLLEKYIAEGLLDDTESDEEVLRVWFRSTNADADLPLELPSELKGKEVSCDQAPGKVKWY